MIVLVWMILGAGLGVGSVYFAGYRGSIAQNMVLGIMGALVGGFGVQLLVSQDFVGYNLFSFFTSMLIAVALLAVMNALARRNA